MNQVRPTRVLLFDIDGTLLLTNGGGREALRQALELEFGLSGAAADVDFSGRTDRAILQEILVCNRLPDDEPHFRRLRDRYVTMFPEVLRQQGGRVLPGARELLQCLRSFDHLLCLVMTGNLTETATHKLEHFGLRPYLGEIFGGEHDLHRDHLARRAAGMIRERYGDEAANRLVVIGDTPADIRCGRAVGAQVIAVCTGRHSREELEAEMPDSVHDDLSNLSPLLRQLTQSDPE